MRGKREQTERRGSKYQRLKRRRMTAGLFRRTLRITFEHPGLSPQKREPVQKQTEDPLSAANICRPNPIETQVALCLACRPSGGRAGECRAVADKQNEGSGR